MRVQNVDVEIIKGNGEGLRVDAVASESIENFPIDHGYRVTVQPGENHQYTIIAELSFAHAIDDVERVREGYRAVLEKAAELNVQALLLIPFGYEKGVITPVASAKVLAQELLKFVRFARHAFRVIYICVTDIDHFETFQQHVIGYLVHVQDTLGMGPYVTVDAIVEMPKGLVIIERTNPPFGWALPGGFVDCGESLEYAVAREVKEETGLDFVDFYQMHTFSGPQRDPRFHTVSTVFIGKGEGVPKAADDARALQVVEYDELLKRDYAFDHKEIIMKYLTQRSL